MPDREFQSFEEFYPFYLAEHRQEGTRLMHFVGTTGFFGFVAAAAAKRNPWLLLPAVVTPYAIAWVSHFFVEKNKPATFKYPLWSLRGDFKLYFDTLRGREGFTYRKPGTSPAPTASRPAKTPTPATASDALGQALADGFAAP